MQEYIDWYNKQEVLVKVLLAIVWVPAFLYRLFSLILKANEEQTSQIVYFILTLIPVIGTVLWITDIVYACKGQIPTALNLEG